MAKKENLIEVRIGDVTYIVNFIFDKVFKKSISKENFESIVTWLDIVSPVIDEETAKFELISKLTKVTKTHLEANNDRLIKAKSASSKKKIVEEVNKKIAEEKSKISEEFNNSIKVKVPAYKFQFDSNLTGEENLVMMKSPLLAK